MAAIELAAKVSYCDAVPEGDQFTAMPLPAAVNRRVIESGVQFEALN